MRALSAIAKAAPARVRRGFRAMRLALVRAIQDEVTLSTYQGRLTIYTRDQYIGRDLFVLREFEWGLSQEVVRWLESVRGWRRGTGTFVDIGANMGVISVGMLHGGFFERAIAIEPEPGNFRLLTTNVRQNGLLDRVKCLQFAASDHSGDLKIALDGKNFGEHHVRSGSARSI
jgi:hypothetical protein